MRQGRQFDIIHAHSFYPAGYCAYGLSYKYNIPFIVTEHNTSVLEETLTSYQKKLLKITIEKCDKIVCESTVLKRAMDKITEDDMKIAVVPTFFSSDLVYSDECRQKNNNDFIFLSIGFLNQRKRHGFVISCFKEAFKGTTNVRLEIIGTGELYNTLQDQITNNGLQGKVFLLGSLDQKNKIKKINECSVFVLASSFENFGVVYIEALACGRPVIATKNGGANDIINETNGILVDVDNREQLVDAFKYMYKNAHLYNLKKIADDCYANYSEDVIVKKLTQIYEQIIKIKNE
jgi:glycosyltransferase involved in cell wall biosynthesis